MKPLSRADSRRAKERVVALSNINADLDTLGNIASAMSILGLIAPANEIAQAIDGIRMNVNRLIA